MQRLATRLSTILLAVAGLHALPAAAQVRSDTTVSGPRVILTDLTPDDGATPYFRFEDANLDPISVSSAVTPAPGGVHEDSGYAEHGGYFVFSPNTRVSLAFDVDIAMTASASGPREQGGAVFVAMLGGATWGPPKDRWERTDSETTYGDVGLAWDGRVVPAFERHETLYLVFNNDSPYDASGQYRALIDVTSHTVAAPVPEASMAAMLALGAGVLGLAKRRRARRMARA